MYLIQCSSELCELRIRVLYAHILCIHVCLYVHIRAYIRAYMSLCYACTQDSLCEALLDKQKKISGMKKRKASKRNLHIVKHVNESLNISSFRSLRKFTHKLPFINTCLTSSFQNVWRKIETVA